MLEKLSDTTGDRKFRRRSASRDRSHSRARSPSSKRRASSTDSDAKQDYTDEQLEAVQRYILLACILLILQFLPLLRFEVMIYRSIIL